MGQYIQNDSDQGLCKLIDDLYYKNKKPEDSSIWCVDLSRNKYLL